MSAVSKPRALVGRRLGQFKLQEKLADGSFGAIYGAEQVGLRRRAVVKILSAHAADTTMQLRFLREARLASALDHPYAAHVYAFGAEPDGLLWIAMELVRGAPLSEVLRASPMPLDAFVPFFERLCEVVHTAHEHAIVHRDIKPQNVMVISRAGALLPKLLDLGIAKDARPASPEERESWDEEALSTIRRRRPRWRASAPPDVEGTRSDGTRVEGRDRATTPRHARKSGPPEGLTGHGAVMGSPSYMAPEQWSGADRVDHRCDIYALGVLAYEAISGHRPFSGSVEDLARQHCIDSVPALPACIPGELHAVLARAMAKEPGDRQSSALELAREVRRASGVVAEPPELPKLARDVVDLALRAYPQPLAEAVAELDGARGAYQALDAAGRLARVAIRWLAVVALAAWWHPRRGGAVLPAVASELLSGLRKRRLNDEEWLELARAVVAPCAPDPDGHPVPELVRLLQGATADEAHRGTVSLAALASRHASRAMGTLPPERAAAEELPGVLAMTEDALRALSFLSSYPLAIVGADGLGELWTGVRRKHRVARPLGKGIAGQLEPGDPVVVGASGKVVSLAPLARALRPSARAEPELFLLDGRGRRGALLVALPGGFEHTSDAARVWLDQVAAISDEPGSMRIALDVPYRGLAPLTAADASVFFGREREVEAFVNRLRAEPLLVVVGPSGAGKSSFIRAGVVPSLGEAFRPLQLRPGATPLRTLRTKLAHVGVASDDLSTESDAVELAARVHAAARARAETIVICVDQFEETFTMARDAEERAVFCAWLAGMALGAADPCRVVLTLRDDFLANAQQESALWGRLAPALELLSTPGAPALRRILVEPARRAGFAFESEALVEKMVRAVAGRPGALALLSFAASKLWEQRDAETCTIGGAAYETMGGIAGALARHGEAVLEAMTPKQRGLVRVAFRRLVTAEGTRAATRHDELLAVLGGDDSARVVVERLVAARLLVVAEGDDGAEYVEVIHEALLAAWPRILDWQREDAAGSRLRDQIRAAARQWEGRKRPRGLLWRDDLLEDYRRWRLQHPGDLTASEEAFGNASLAERSRGRRLRATMIGFLAIAAVVTSYVAWQQSVARRAAQRATVEAGQATEAAKKADYHAEQSAFRARDAARLAAAHLHVDDPTTQLALLRDVESSDPLPEWAPAARAALNAGVAAVVYADQSNPVWAVAFSPDGARVAATDGDDVRIFAADGAGEPLLLRGHQGRVTGVSFSRDGRRIASSSLDGTIRVFAADGSGQPLVLAGHAARVWGVSFSPDGRLLASVSSDKTVRVWNADGSGAPVVLRGHRGNVTSVAFSPDGRHVASSSEDRTVRVWNADGSGKPLVLRGHEEAVSKVAFSPDGRRIVSGSEDRTVRVWNADGSGSPVVLAGHAEGVVDVDFSPDGQHVASSSLDDTVRVWNADGSGRPRVLRGHEATVMGVSFSPDGRRIVSGDYVGVMRVWNVDAADDPLVLRGHTDMVEGLAISPDGRRIASGSSDKTVRVWNADGSGAPLVLRGHQGMIYSASFSPDGRRIATGSMDRTVRIWNADGTGKPVVLRGHAGWVYGVSFSPDGDHVASASADRSIRVWNADGSGEPLVLEGHAGAVLPIDFSPDGRRIVSGSEDTTVRVWNADGAGEPLVLRGHTGVVLDVSFSRDGRKIASASADRTVRVWNADGSGEPLVFRSDAPANGISFSPDGRTVAWNAGATIQLRGADGLGDTVLLQGHAGVVTNLRFSPDGRRIVSSSEDKTIRVWSDLTRLEPGDARLWQATRYCLPRERLEKFLGVDAELAGSLHARCVARVREAGAPRDPKAPELP